MKSARVWLLFAACAASACRPAAERSAPPPPPAAAEKPAAVPAVVEPAAPAAVPPEAHKAPLAPDPIPRRDFAGANLPDEVLLDQLAHARITNLHPVGSTSTVFKTALQAPIAAALKAATVERPDGPRAEVAAYRLARVLGLPNVPPAITRRVPLAELRARFDGDPATWPALEARLLVDRDRHVSCAAIYWIEGLTDLGLEQATVDSYVTRYLTLATPLADTDRPLAAQLSTLLAFDYLIGNWDRWSGSNLKGDATGKTLFMRDHDVAFARRLREPLQRRMLDPVVRTQRFSRDFYRRLRALTRDAFVRELASDPGGLGGPLLDARALDGVFDRRAALLSHLEATLEEQGAANVLVFP